jgi:hypothetical protein
VQQLVNKKSLIISRCTVCMWKKRYYIQMHSLVCDVTNTEQTRFPNLVFSSLIKYTEREERENFEAEQRNKKLLQHFAAKCYGINEKTEKGVVVN